MKTFFILLTVISFSVSAQQYPGMDIPNMDTQGMDSAQMRNMMENMKKSQQCMSKINPAELQRVENITRKHELTLEKLCQAGKRKQAEKKGMEIGEKMLRDPTVKKINKCQNFLAGQIPTSPGIGNDGMHICDQYAYSSQY